MYSFGRLLLWAILALNPVLHLRAQKWDPVAEFGVVNPSGVWSYGYSDRANGMFNLSTHTTTDARYSVWGGTPSGPHVVKNATGVTQNDGSRTHAPNQLNLDPSFDGRYAILRFTAPATGLRASGRFVGIDSTTTDVAVVIDGVVVFSGNINGKGDFEAFDVAFNGLAGETIDFAVGQGTSGSLFDGTGLELTIEPASGIPPCAPVPSDLAVWLPGNGLSIDVAGGNQVQLLQGAGYDQGKVGEAFSLVGRANYIAVTDSSSVRPASKITLEGWFRFNEPNLGSIQTLAGKTVGSAFHNSYALYYQNGELRGIVGNVNALATPVMVAFRPDVGVWHHIAFTYNDETGSQALYINGRLAAANTTDVSMGYDDHPFTLGAEYENGQLNYYFPGLIDEFSLYSRDLSEAELSAIYRASEGKCRTETGPSVAAVRNIHGRSNIYASGGSLPSDSFPPALFTFPARPGQVLRFSSVEGSVSFNENGLPFFGPDGGPGVPPTDIQGINGLSGIKHRLTSMLVGVFKDASSAVDSNAPPTLDFNTIGPDFSTLSPLLNQVFFIGDAKTSSGTVQEFDVPAGATRLFLGLADAWNGSCVCGVPQAYIDNGGGFQATFTLGIAPVITGQVLDEQGAPLAGVEVGGFRDATQFVALGFSGATTNAVTDQNGVFTLSGYSAGTSAFVIPRIDYNRNGRDDDGRYFDPPNATATASSNPASLVFRMRATTDSTAPTVQITTPNPLGATEFSSLDRVQGSATDTGAGMLDVWAALVKTVNGVQWVYNWNTRTFERTNRDHPDYYGRTTGQSGASKDFTLALPGLAAASYQVRLIAVDNARNFRRLDLNFRIVPQTQTLTQAGTFTFPPLPPGFPISLLANSGGSTLLNVTGNTTLSSLELAAANNSKLAVVIEKGKQLATQNGITLSSNASLASIGKLLGNVQNIAGSLTKGLSALSGVSAALAAAKEKGLLAQNIQPAQPKAKTAGLAAFQPALRAFAVESDITGSIAIEGDYEQLPGAILGIGIRGTNFAAQEYDRLEVSGSAILEGRIGIVFYDPAAPGVGQNLFAPPLGATFDIVVATNVVVGDLDILAPIWNGGLSFAWSIVDLPDGRQALRLEVVEAAPYLVIELTETGVEVLFPPAFSAYHLETTGDLGAGAWTEVGGGADTVQLPRSDRARFFRAKR